MLAKGRGQSTVNQNANFSNLRQRFSRHNRLCFPYIKSYFRMLVFLFNSAHQRIKFRNVCPPKSHLRRRIKVSIILKSDISLGKLFTNIVHQIKKPIAHYFAENYILSTTQSYNIKTFIQYSAGCTQCLDCDDLLAFPILSVSILCCIETAYTVQMSYMNREKYAKHN